MATLADAHPPALSPLLKALWHDARGDWDSAHHLAQDVDSQDGSLVHAYLHRKEGDTANAGYWYRRADRPTVSGPLEDEWRALVVDLLMRERAAGAPE